MIYRQIWVPGLTLLTASQASEEHLYLATKLMQILIGCIRKGKEMRRERMHLDSGAVAPPTKL